MFVVYLFMILVYLLLTLGFVSDLVFFARSILKMTFVFGR